MNSNKIFGKGKILFIGRGVTFSLSLFILGCGLSLPISPRPPIDTQKTVYVNFLDPNIEDCTNAFRFAQGFFQSYGVEVRVNSNSPRKFTCLPCAPLWLRLLTLISEAGLQQGDISYARMCGTESNRNKIVIHELGHLFGASHSDGLMSQFYPFSSSLSSKTINQIN